MKSPSTVKYICTGSVCVGRGRGVTAVASHEPADNQ